MKKLLSFRVRIIIGLVIWFGWSVFNFQYFFHASWGRILLLLGPLIIVPLTLRTVLNVSDFSKNKLIQKIETWVLPAAILLAISFLFEKGISAPSLWLNLRGGCVPGDLMYKLEGFAIPEAEQIFKWLFEKTRHERDE